VRLVNSGFGEDADSEYDGLANGWPLFLDNLRLYLNHFAGQRAAPVIVTASVAGRRQEVWARISAALGAAGVRAGERVVLAADGAPRLAGVVDRVQGERLTLLLDEPAPGVALLAVEGADDPVFASVYAYLFGDGAPELAARDEPRWRSWLADRFPAPDPAG
jgi:hypothetical protein